MFNTKEYYQENKEYILGRQAEHHMKFPHIKKINRWKELGIKLRPGDDWTSMYLFYVTCEYCENCGGELTDERNNTSSRRNLDHCHKTGLVRDVLCHSCNIKRG